MSHIPAKLWQALSLACCSALAITIASTTPVIQQSLSLNLTHEAVVAARSNQAHQHVLSPRSQGYSTYSSGSTQDYLGAIGSKWLYHWPQEKFPIKVYIAPGTHVRGYHSAWRDILMSAFDEWCNACDNKMAWQLVSSPKGADVVCCWTNCMPGTETEQEAGDTGTLVQTDHSTGRSTILQADMKLLACLDGVPFNDDEMKKICLHEVGHAFGMQGHSPTPTDIMYPQTTSRQPTHLTDRDIASMRRLYASYPSLGIGYSQENPVQ